MVATLRSMSTARFWPSGVSWSYPGVAGGSSSRRITDLLDHVQHALELEATVQSLRIHLVRTRQASSLSREFLEAHGKSVYAGRLETPTFMQRTIATPTDRGTFATTCGAIANATDVAAGEIVGVWNDVGSRALVGRTECEADATGGAAIGGHICRSGRLAPASLADP